MQKCQQRYVLLREIVNNQVGNRYPARLWRRVIQLRDEGNVAIYCKKGICEPNVAGCIVNMPVTVKKKYCVSQNHKFHYWWHY